MFDYIFNGAIGDMLAPVVPSNKLFLAIQHHKNSEIQQLMLNMDSQLMSEHGIGAIHIASRYNNAYALDLILGKGIILLSLPIGSAC
jgi:hypothetical protein